MSTSTLPTTDTLPAQDQPLPGSPMPSGLQPGRQVEVPRYTVTLNTHGCTRHYPCANSEDMQVLRGALIHKFGDLQVEVRTLAPGVNPSLTPPDSGLTLSPTRHHRNQRRRPHQSTKGLDTT